ncbi:MAG: UDP-glucose 4-epimerase GalE [Acidobacteria bacterium]|nr:UDP-glucose 4-epimerase GalE [Acidobacteriota bacterium]MBV9625305.1 UDP-glucose 4-epimerase GalE [Acidobacteriota bacterium]
MSILVVGGAGYIGSHAAHILRRRGYDVIIYDNLSTGYKELAEGFELIVGDIADASKLGAALARSDAVMHFAAHAYVGESVENPRKYFKNNVTSALALLDAVVESRVRKFIFSSTCAVYGNPVKVPITESNPRQPVNPYGATKLAFENALEAYSQAYALRYVSFRYFNAAGADDSATIGEHHEPETHLIPLILQTIQGRRSALEIFGDDYPTADGTCIRDYIHVNDLAEAHVLGLEYLSRGHSIAMNLGTGRGYSVREVISAVEKVTGQSVPIRIGPRRPGDPPELVAEPARAEELLRWKARRSLEEIISTAWSWQQKSQTAIREV